MFSRKCRNTTMLAIVLFVAAVSGSDERAATCSTLVRSIRTSVVPDRILGRECVVFRGQCWQYGKSGNTRRHRGLGLTLSIRT